MPSMRFILKTFEGHVLDADFVPGWTEAGGSLAVLEPAKMYEGGRTYLVDAGYEPSAHASVGEGAAFLFCGNAQGPAPKNRLAIYLDEPLVRVFNVMDRIMRKERSWKEAFDSLRAEPGETDFQSVVSLASNLGRCPALMANEQGKIICSSLLRESPSLRVRPFVNDLASNPAAQEIVESFVRSGSSKEAYPTGAGSTVHCHEILHPGGSRSIMIMEDVRGELDIETLTALAAGKLSRISRKASLKAVHEDIKAFLSCWEDIVGMNLTTTVEVRDAISHLPHKVDRFVSLALVSFPHRKARSPYRNALLQLRRFFPNENMTLYQGDIIIMLSRKERTLRPNFEDVDTDALSEFLIENDAIMVVTSKTRRLDGLLSIYKLAKRTALLAFALNDSLAQKRIVYYEDYSIYCLIDLAVRQYLADPENNDVVHLVHTAVIQLTRYDREHGTDLRDLLYHYLMCDRNAAATAAATFMHRNTVLNKVNKINSVLQLDLGDPRLRQKLILSCQVILYMERVMNLSLGQ